MPSGLTNPDPLYSKSLRVKTSISTHPYTYLPSLTLTHIHTHRKKGRDLPYV
ncbi:hypothetical protein BDB00DRAFT_846304, partial [Zychaea mexicana]|uniref:uncharacterized protein n=1 Tax=Zychaea mexicana TaxID=64656 RepID=UPI0022FEBD54